MAAEIRITVQIARLIVEGMDPVEAVRAVCGDERTDQMISDLYDQLREWAA